jgi:hypothetical protein
VKLKLLNTWECLKACRASSSTGENFILDYNIENGSAEKENGKLTAVVSVFLQPTVHNPNDQNFDIGKRAAGNGLVMDGSCGSTGERKQKTVAFWQEGSLRTEPNVAYRLQYLIEIEMFTEGHGWDATQWMYRAKIAPGTLYLSK